MSEDLANLSNFDGQARLFPLPNLVLFPQVIQPLHVFEARYKELTADALASDRLIAMALLQPGWEADYGGKPALYDVACLGRIVADQRQDDGRYNLLLRGVARIRILSEIESGRSYRTARVEILNDLLTAPPHAQHHLRGALRQESQKWMAKPAELSEQWQRLLDSDLSLSALCDIVSFAVPLETQVKQQLLAELDVERRVRFLLDQLRTGKPAGAESRSPFPPAFSDN